MVSVLASRPSLIERLFVTKTWNNEGIYKLRICHGGDWVDVTIDNLFPCSPFGEPLFAKCPRNELWVMLLEKSYAKLLGSYYALKAGTVAETLLDLTGLPTSSYNFEDEYVKDFISNGQFWNLLKYYES